MSQMEALLGEVPFFFRPIVEAIEDEDSVVRYFQVFGYDIQSIDPEVILQEIAAIDPPLVSTLESLMSIISADGDDVGDVVQNVFSSLNILGSIDSLASIVGDGEAFFLEVFDWLTFVYFSTRVPFAAAIL